MTTIAIKMPSDKDRTLYQNQSVYDKAVAELVGDEHVTAFTTYVLAREPKAEVRIFVNPCTRYWTPGTPPDYALFVGLRDAEGNNRLCYNGGGNTVEIAVDKAVEYLKDFAEREAAEVLRRLARVSA